MRRVRRSTVCVVAVIGLAAGLVSGCRMTGVATVAAGRHSCAVNTSGRVSCWGANDVGQLGEAPPSAIRFDPREVAGVTDASEVVVGDAFTCVLAGGSVSCWGGNAHGQLGDGSTVDRATPAPVAGVVDAVGLSAGANHVCAVLGDATLRCWGANGLGQLGDLSTVDRSAPVAPAGALADVAEVDAGDGHTCARLADGTARCWGDDADGQIGDGVLGGARLQPTIVVGLTGATAIATGGGHSCALVAAGTARCWGRNGAGQLGDGTQTTRSGPQAVQGLAGATRIDAGRQHTCADLGGTVWCWGDNSAGQFGNAKSTSSLVPVVTHFTGIATLSVGRQHTCATFPDATVRCSGNPSTGSLGDGTAFSGFEPGLVGWALPVQDFVHITTGGFSTCGVQAAGDLRCWGDNGWGQLGEATDELLAPGYPGRWLVGPAVPGLTGVTSAAVGASHGCAVTDGHVWCWGRNRDGELGDGTTIDSPAPVPVSGISTATQVEVGGVFSCARLASGSVSCWGGDAYGQLGNGPGGASSTPVSVSGITDATQISVGNDFGCAVSSGGAVSCWGRADGGQLGDGSAWSPLFRDAPVPAIGLGSGVVQVSAGGWHACAVLFDGTARCWGHSARGNGTASVTGATPAAPTGVTTAMQISAGHDATCVVLADGTVRCWGWIPWTGSTAGDDLVPVAIPGLTDVQEVSVADQASRAHGCAIRLGGSVDCWGKAAYGETAASIGTEHGPLPARAKVR